jgi:hypothetical protein
MIKILIAGDICPIGRNKSLFLQGNAQALLNDLQPEFQQAHLSIANLECPLINDGSPSLKVGPHLGAPMDCIKGLKAMAVDVIGLANNHLMDHGSSGLRSTIQTLDDYSIMHVGGGENIYEARKILVREVHGVRFGILAVAEHEFGIAEKKDPGANPLDLIDCVRNIDEHRSEFDQLIVLVHGGSEMYQYPRPRMRDISHFLVEQGARAIIWQHSHCAGCMEIYLGAPIVYGQGNFLFDQPAKPRMWHEGILICLEINDTGELGARLIPYRQSDSEPGAHAMAEGERKSFMEGFLTRSEAILDEAFVDQQWDTFCENNKRYYLHRLRGKASIFRRVMGKLNLLHYLDTPAIQRTRLNIIRCESHRDLLIKVLTREAKRG